MSARDAVLYLAFWVSLLALYLLTGLFDYGPPMPGQAVVNAIAHLGATAVLGVGVWLAATRAPWPAGPVRRALWVAAHAAGAVAFGALRLPLDWALVTVLSLGAQAPAFPAEVGPQLRGGVLFYVALASAAYAAVALRAARDREAARLAAVATLARTEADLARAEADRTAAELAALRAHLQPHFLFNTLHAVGALVRSSPPAASRAVEAFGDLFRYSLRNDRERRSLVPFAEEIDFARTYLGIEALRLGDRLRVRWDVSDDALDALVPPLLVQPLVENAVRHGIAPRKRGGTITVRAHVDAADRLHVEVHDDGDGGPTDLDGPGYGVRGVRRTLDHLYGDAAGLDVWSRPGQGFHVRIHLPYAVVPSAPPATP